MRVPSLFLSGPKIVLSFLAFTAILGCGSSTCPAGSMEISGKCQSSASILADAGADGGDSSAAPCKEGFSSVDGACVALEPCTESESGDGPCDPHATCAVADHAAQCTCNEGYEGDGKTCTRNPCIALEGEADACGAEQVCAAKSETEVECTCTEGFDDCDGEAGNGCEVELASDAKNCGACGFDCAERLACVEGACEQRVSRLAAKANVTFGVEFCGLTPQGNLLCWLFENNKVLKKEIRLSIPGTQVAGAPEAWCVRSEESVFCQGSNQFHLLGSPNIAALSHTLTVPGLQDLSTGPEHVCVVAKGQVFCWGQGLQKQLGDGQSYTPQAPSRAYTSDRPVISSPSGAPLTGATRVAAGFYHGCAVLQTGGVQCWGSTNSYGDSHAPEDVLADDGSGKLQDAAEICAGMFYSCAVRKNGSVACWGNDPLWPNDGDAPGRNRYRTVKELKDVVSVSCGALHVCALNEQGEAYCWGNNSFGQLGLGTTESKFTTPVRTLSEVAEIATGTGTTCARLRNGRIYCWGGLYSSGTNLLATVAPIEITDWP